MINMMAGIAFFVLSVSPLYLFPFSESFLTSLDSEILVYKKIKKVRPTSGRPDLRHTLSVSFLGLCLLGLKDQNRSPFVCTTLVHQG